MGKRDWIPPDFNDLDFAKLEPHLRAFIEEWIPASNRDRYRHFLTTHGKLRGKLRSVVWAHCGVGEVIPWGTEPMVLANRLRKLGAPDICLVLTDDSPDYDGETNLDEAVDVFLAGGPSECHVIFCVPGKLILQSSGSWPPYNSCAGWLLTR